MNKHLNFAATTSAAKPTAKPAHLSRRHFIVAGATAAGGFAIGVGLLPRDAEAFTVDAKPWAQPMDQEGYSPYDIDAWIAIEPDDTILIRYTRSEMGQGSMTALPMIVAEELQCDWSKVRVEYGSANRSARENNIYGDMSSVGSHSVRDSHFKLQQVGASARERLIAAAAAQWNVPASECKAANSVVLHPASNRSIGYGALASAAAQIKLASEPAIKTPEQYTFMGKPQPRVDVPLKVNGAAQYSIDTRLPDMVYAAIVQCPVPGGKLVRVDDTPLKNAPGIVQVVRLSDAVAVVATDTFWRAKQALAKLHPEWDVGAAGSTDSAQFAKEYREAALTGSAPVARNDGNVDQALTSAGDKALSAVYEVPYLAHATMEPMNATVHLQPDRLDVWVGTQSADRTLTAAAAVSGLKPEQVYIHNTFIGGGFGRKSKNDDMAQAIQIAKAINRPVKLIWTREDDIRHDRYRPQAAIAFKGAVGADGMPTALYIRTAVGSLLRSLGINKVENGIEPMAVEGLSNHPYKIANSKVECALKNTHIPVSFWRSVGASQNAFAIESFMDELAHAGGQDPYQFRRTLLAGKPDWLGVLDMVAEKGNWGKPIEAGRARGIAIHECYGTIVGEVAEITIKNGELKVDRITLAADAGHVVNPLSFAEQMEGGCIFALTAALYGKVSVKNGVPEQGNFDTYPMVRFAQAPKIDVHLALSGGKKWGGAGEPGGAPTAAAVCNAIFALTGKRIRSLPLIDQDLSKSA